MLYCVQVHQTLCKVTGPWHVVVLHSPIRFLARLATALFLRQIYAEAQRTIVSSGDVERKDFEAFLSAIHPKFINPLPCVRPGRSLHGLVSLAGALIMLDYPID
jgi:hypothetical protein